ncbi:MAG TPA: FkbM family methyltransferase [Candidatus Competibacteraceae bacterium]|nr:FkbM family methyltransferase [Candidatus Competibacteraceae bacterium]
MSFVSYAQNLEDVMLWRALKHVEKGFYIDIGAWSPYTDSVTRAFYERGWRGINVEPNSEWCERLIRARPDDIVLQTAIAEQPGVLEFYTIPSTGLSTLDRTIADRHASHGWEVVPTEVDVITLDMLWERHVGARDVHFLKVDVEGFEEQVLAGNDWQRHRPWVVVVEATEPMTQIETHEIWEPRLLEAGYIMVYADGLNRFYLAAEHAELTPAFRYPPNVFDGFTLIAQHEAETRATAAESRAVEAGKMLHSAQTQVADAQRVAAEALAHTAELHRQLRQIDAHIQHLTAIARQLDAVYASWSWRITAPLRFGLDVLLKRSGRKPGLPSAPSVKGLMRSAVGSALGKPRLVAFVHRCLRPFPSLHAYVTKRVMSVMQTPPPQTRYSGAASSPMPFSDAHLPASAQRVLADLRRAMGRG